MIGEAALSLVSNGLLFIIISRVSGPELLGTYALAFGWLLLFQGISSFGIPDYLMREVGALGHRAAQEVVHAMLLGLASGTLAIALMTGAVRLMGYPAYIVQVITIASLALIPAFLTTACRSVFLALRQMHFAFLALLAEVSLLIAASTYLLLSGYGVFALMCVVVVAKLCSACIALTLLYGRVLPATLSIDPALLVRVARVVVTFGLGNSLAMATVRINTIMASLWVSIAAVGQFAAATKIMEIGLMGPNLFVQLLMSRMAFSFRAKHGQGQASFDVWYRTLFAFVMPTCVGGWVFARLILETLFGSEFGDAAWVLRILMIYLAIESVDAVMSVILRAAERQREDVIRYASNPLTNVLISLALLPPFGTIGAAIGRVGGAAASAILRNRLIARRLFKTAWLRYASKPAIISLATGVACSRLQASHPASALGLYVVTTVALLGLTSSISPTGIREIMGSPSTGR